MLIKLLLFIIILKMYFHYYNPFPIIRGILALIIILLEDLKVN